MTTPVDRTLPHNLEAERSVLGAILLHEPALNDAAECVTDGDFYRDGHRRIFRAMVALSDRHVAIDLTTLREELGRRGELADVGGPAYIAALVDGVPRATNVEHYARIIQRKSALRKLIVAGTQMISRAYDAEDDATLVLEEAERSILGLASGTAATGFESIGSIAKRAMDVLERTAASREAVTGVASGFIDLDNLTRGFQPGTLVVLGARPGVGKTSFAINVAQHAAMHGRVVGVYSLEMPSEELFLRQVASTARIDSHRLQSGFIGEREWARVSDAVTQITNTAMVLDETPGIGLFMVRSRARRLKAERGLDLLVLDYLQLMTTSTNTDNRAQAIGAITMGLKGLAKELRIPILLLSQLSREPDKRGTRPRLSDLRDSGSIEQDADIVMFLHRDEQDRGEAVTDLIIAKHRNGPTGVVKLLWNEQQTRFDSYAAYEAHEDQRLPMGDR